MVDKLDGPPLEGPNDKGRDGRCEASDRPDAYEAKRLAARRRFLLGGAAALPIVATLGQKEAWAASRAVCQSRSLGYGDGFTQQDYQRLSNQQSGIQTSLFCRPGWN